MRDWLETVDAPDLGSGTERCRGSSPLSRTIVAAELIFGSQGEVGKGRTSQYGIGGDSVHLYFRGNNSSLYRKGGMTYDCCKTETGGSSTN